MKNGELRECVTQLMDLCRRLLAHLESCGVGDDGADGAVDLGESVDLSHLLDDELGPVDPSGDRWIITDRGLAALAAADAPADIVRIAE